MVTDQWSDFYCDPVVAFRLQVSSSLSKRIRSIEDDFVFARRQ